MTLHALLFITLKAKSLCMSLSRYLDNFFWFKIQINYIPVIVLINPITYPKHKSNELLFGKLEPVKVLASKKLVL